MITGSISGERAWAECESVIRRFEDAWREQARPDVGDYLVAGTPHSVRLLVELVHIDLEFRLRAGDFARAEDYASRFAELSDPELLLDLIAAEFSLRNRHTPPAWPEEFLLRFPEHTPALRGRLPIHGGTGWFSATRPAERPGSPLSGPPVIPGYEIQGELGRGGMGVVYQARDLLLHRIVAVKTFATVPRPESCARFAREAEAIARLDHPNIVPVYEVGEWRADGGPAVPFFVMKWYPGGNMEAAPCGPGTDVGAQAGLVETIARAVHHAHQRGVLHRDLKPSNILLDDAGRPHVADFGLAGRVEPEAATMTAVVAGTPAYMAPEQAKSPRQVSTAADVYGLGAILYHQLTGQSPFEAETPLATLDLVARTPAARPSAVNPAVPRDLDTICLKCLEKDPARRYASAGELADDLERYRKGLPIAARPAQAWELAWRRMRRHPLVTVLIFITLATLVGAVVVLSDSNAQIRAQEKEAQNAYLRECALRYQLEATLAKDQATRRQLEETLAREQRALYLERVTSAGRLYAANQLPEAWALLDQCPEAFRGWEWRYLNSLRHTKRVALAGHAGFVTRVGFLADGRAVSADTQGIVRVWDVGAEKSQHAWPVGRSAIAALAVHPTKNWAAVADLNSAWVINVDTGRTIGKFGEATWVAFSPDGTRLATADKKGVRLWVVPGTEPNAAKDGAAWELAGELGIAATIYAGVFTRDGKRLITSAQDRSIRTWDLETFKELGCRFAPQPVTGLSLASGGKILAEAHFGAVLFTDHATGQMRDRLEYPTGDRTTLASGPDDRTVVVSGANGEVVVWDVVRRQTVRVYRGHSGRVGALAAGPNNRLASGGSDRLVRVWDAKSEPEVRTLAWVGDGVGGLAVSPDGTRVAVGPRHAADPESRVPIFDAATGTEGRSVPGWPHIAYHPTSGNFATSLVGGGAALWDPATGKEIWRKPFSEPRDPGLVVVAGGQRMAFSPDGELLALWDLRAGGVQLWKAADGSDPRLLPTEKQVVHAIAFAPNAPRLAVATLTGITMWDVPSRTRLPWGETTPGASAMAFSPSGQWLATVDIDGVIRLRDAATGREVRHFIGTALRVNMLCFSPDGTRLVTGGADRTVRVWDVESGRELLSLPGVTESVRGLAWDAKNDRIYALDFAVRAWGAK